MPTLPENSYGLTVGINAGSYPVTARLAQQIVDWAKADGHGNFRIQLDMQYIWITQSDTTGGAGWDFSPLDDAVKKLTTAGFTITFPLRIFPRWMYSNPAYKASDEVPSNSNNNDGWYQPDPAGILTCAKVIAARYNGSFNIPGYGPMRIHKLEIGNEEFNLHFTSSTTAMVLNQAVNSGTAYPTVAITAASSIAIPSGQHLQFGTSGGSGDAFKLSQAVNVGDTLIHIVANGGGAFTASQTLASGANITLIPYGVRTPVSSLYDGHLGITNTANPTPQPVRDPYWLQQAILGVADAVKALNPFLRLGAGAVWWMDDRNFTAFVAGLGSAIGKVEYINFHYYSKTADPHLGAGHSPAVTLAINNMATAAAAAGFPNIPIECTEFGWNLVTELSGNETTQQTWMNNFLVDLKATQKCRRVYLYTYDNSTSPNGASLYRWDGTVYHQVLALGTLKSFMVANPYLIKPTTNAVPLAAKARSTFKIAAAGTTAKPLSTQGQATFVVSPPINVPSAHITMMGRDAKITLIGRG